MVSVRLCGAPRVVGVVRELTRPCRGDGAGRPGEGRAQARPPAARRVSVCPCLPHRLFVCVLARRRAAGATRSLAAAASAARRQASSNAGPPCARHSVAARRSFCNHSGPPQLQLSPRHSLSLPDTAMDLY
jgi:hypothetical protein